MKTLLKWILLFVVALIVFIPLSIIGIIYTIVKHTIKLDYSLKQAIRIFQGLAIATDEIANVCAGEILNDTLLKKRNDGTYIKTAYKYGKPDDTISAVTGVNQERLTLDKDGRFLTKILSIILEPNHSIRSIKKEKNYE